MPPRHGVIGPDGQVILTALPEFPGAGSQMIQSVLRVDFQTLTQKGIEIPPGDPEVLLRNQGEGRRMPALFVDQKNGVNQGVVPGQDLRLEAGPFVLDFAQLQVGISGSLEAIVQRGPNLLKRGAGRISGQGRGPREKPSSWLGPRPSLPGPRDDSPPMAHPVTVLPFQATLISFRFSHIPWMLQKPRA
jgi:hypothetical protein